MGLRHQDLRAHTGISGTALNRLFHGEGSSVATLLAVMRALGLEGRLFDFLPVQDEGPLARLARPTKQKRQRVRGFAEPNKPWVWGDNT